MTLSTRLLRVFLLTALALGLSAHASAAEFAFARIYIEYNFSANDLGFHVTLDGEDWRSLKITNPKGKSIYEVSGKGAFKELGMTEMFFEGAEPALSEFPLEDLLDMFPEGKYTFAGTTVDGERIVSIATLSHAVPNGPVVSAKVEGDSVTILWDRVTSPARIIPDQQVEIVGYQVIVEEFEVTLPPTSTKVTVPQEFVKSLQPGVHLFEVLAIDASGNQTLTEGSFNITGSDQTGVGPRPRR